MGSVTSSISFSLESLARIVEAQPRVRLAALPTPLEDCPRLSERLGGPRILVKRDDLTGLAFGGNKTRNLEFIFGRERVRGTDCYIAFGATQSNLCRQVAAAGARLGLDIFLILTRSVHNEAQGNLFLDHLFGAKVTILDSRGLPGSYDISEMRAKAETLARELAENGRRPSIYPALSSSPVPAAGYLNAILEMEAQFAADGVLPSHIVLTSGGGSTHAVLALAYKALNIHREVIGVSIRKPADAVRRDVAKYANEVAEFYRIPSSLSADEVRVRDEYRGEGYAIPTQAALDAIGVAARTEGLILDPVYTGKAMSGLIGLVQKGELESGHTVVFLHTGGTPATFAYAEEILGSCGDV